MSVFLDSLCQKSIHDLAAQETAQSLVLTVNNRLSLSLRQRLLAPRQSDKQGPGVMQLPTIQPWQRYLEELKQEYIFVQDAAPRVLLDSFASQLQWEHVLKQDEVDNLSLNVLARNLNQARELEAEWGVEVSDLESNQEYEFYQKYLTQYLARIQALRANDASQIKQQLLAALQQHQLSTPYSTIYLLGFNELSAFQKQLLGALQQQGLEICLLRLDRIPAKHTVAYPMPDSGQEWQAAVSWAKQQLQANPVGRYAIVDPQLQSHVAMVQRYVHQGLEDESGQLRFHYNISVGRALNEWQLVGATLMWLQILVSLPQSQKIAVTELGQALLQGRYSLLANYAAQACYMDAEIRKLGQPELTQAQLMEQFEQHMPQFAPLFNAASDYLQALHQQTLPLNVWIEHFFAVLDLLQFPGLGALNSQQYQISKEFEKTLHKTTLLHACLPAMEAPQAFTLLERVCQRRLYQPQLQVQSRLDILGLLEAEGGNWDGIWVLGMQDDVLPMPPNPNPFLPIAAQRRANVPRASQENDFLWAKRIIEDLNHCAPTVIYSWHEFEDERETRISALLNAVERQAFALETPTEHQAADYLQKMPEDEAPTYKGALSGGYDLLETQSRNPLWSFARYRLGMKALEPYPHFNFDPRVLGTIVHKVLEAFWHDHPSSEAARRLGKDGIKDKVHTAIFVTLGLDRNGQSYAPIYKKLFSELIADSVCKSITMELYDRDEFTVIETEKQVEIPLGDLQIGLRLDRIDQAERGGIFFLDYKTGNLPNIKKDWDQKRGRMINLQLPLYAAHYAQDKQVDGVILLSTKLSNSEIKYYGQQTLKEGRNIKLEPGLEVYVKFSNAKGVVHKPEEWQDILSDWRQKTSQLAQEILAGYAKNQYWEASDLEYCDIKSFLRINQEALEEAKDE
ncbi:PD-(D/E)XK nuclease family protein [Brackiella oedipodis]|uniref:PD-(D/E)XK nuclease family protein n=1 Tax=Brackiella oedipodis TaxID=124225 RepID=UPI00049210B1|nr:PD-(D/E)XK nuclease family protein [Brackiella oedipodis]